MRKKRTEDKLNEKNVPLKKKYSLYLLSSSPENIQEAMKYRFNRINQKYVLIYADNLLGMLHESHYHIIDEKETRYLSDSEKVWLLEANVQIIAEESEKKQQEILNSLGERISRLEEELEKESEKIKGKSINEH